MKKNKNKFSFQLLDGSVKTGSSFDRTEEDDPVNPLDALRRRGQRKWLELYPAVADRLSSSSQKRLQLVDLAMEDHIPDIRYLKNLKKKAKFE